MNKDNLEGNIRSAVGQGEKAFGQAIGDKAGAAQGVYDDVAGRARSAMGSAKDAIGGGSTRPLRLTSPGCETKSASSRNRFPTSHKISSRRADGKS